MSESISEWKIGVGRARKPYVPKQIVCPECSGNISQFSEHSQTMVCPWCDSLLQLSTAEISALKKVSKWQGWEIPLHTPVYWKDIQYKVIAQMLYRNSEDQISEYLLFHPFQPPLWLAVYEDEISISSNTRMIPPAVFDDKRAIRMRTKPIETPDKQRWKFVEKASYRLKFVNGALPWIANVGDQKMVMEFRGLDKSNRHLFFEVEQDVATKEIEGCFTEILTAKMIEEAFPNTELSFLKKQASDNWVKSKNKIVFVVATIFAVFFFYQIWTASDGTQILSTHLEPKDLEGEILTPSFHVSDTSGAVQISLHAPISNAWAYFDLAIVKVLESTDQQDSFNDVLDREEQLSTADGSTILYTDDFEISYYYGTEGGEAWTEGSNTKDLMLKFEDPGEYRLLWHAISGYGESSDPTGINHSALNIAIYQSVEITRYYWIAATASSILVLLLGVVLKEDL